MVDLLVRQQKAPQHALHHQSMFGLICFRTRPDANIASAIDESSAFPVAGVSPGFEMLEFPVRVSPERVAALTTELLPLRVPSITKLDRLSTLNARFHAGKYVT